MPTNFQKAKRRVKTANGWSDPISYATSSESVELTDGTDLQTKIDNLGTASTKDVATIGNASSSQVVMGNDTRLTDARPANDVNSWAKAPTKPTYTASEVGTYTSTEIDNKIEEAVSSCYHPSGSKTVAELISSLLVSANEGSVYDMSDSGTTTSDFREGAGHPIKAGDNVGIVNVGTTQSPVYKFDLLSGFVDLSAYYTKTESDNKYVTKETGKGLSTNDYTTADKNKLAGIEAEANKTVVDSVMSDSSTNPLQNKVITKELEGTKTTSGNPLTIEDAAPVNAVNLSVDLEPIQDLHGYDHPWVGGAGKNKLPMTVEGIKAANGGASTWNGNSKTIGGVAFTILTDSDGNVTGIRCNGQANGFSFYAFDGSVTVPSGSKINLNATKNNGNFDCTAFNNGTVIGSISGYSPQTADVTLSDTTVTRVSFYFNSSYNDDITIYPMIRLSTETDGSFAPYTNKSSISGRSEEAIQRVGKNLFGGLDFANSLYNASSTHAIDTTNKTVQYNRRGGSSSTVLFNQFKENTEYTLILTGKVDVANTKNNSILFRDSNEVELSTILFETTTKTRKKITVGGNGTTIKDLVLGWANGGVATLYYEECGIFEGNVSIEEFEEYLGKTYTIQLGQTVYGCHHDVTRGKMVVDRGYAEFDGSSDENWVFGFISNSFYQAQLPFNSMKNSIGIISNAFETISTADRGLKNGIVEFTDSQIRVALLSDFGITSAELWKTWLSSNPLQVVYELATPFTIDLTPQQIKLLKGTNSIYANSGDLSIKYQPDNVLGDLLAEAEIGYDKQIEYIKTSLVPSRERNDITDRLQMLPQAIAEQNLEKYGYKIGDYFQGVESTPYTYSLADYNTFKGTLTPYCLTQNHLGIVVDTHTTSQWYSGDASSVGYNGSTLHTYLKSTVMDNIKADMIALLGGSTGLEHLLPHSKLLTTALANWGWQTNQYISALSEIQAIGSTVWSANSYQIGEVAKKLEIFNKYKWTEIFEGRYPWLRDMQSASYACYLNGAGNADYYTVANANYVVGLINFY